MDVITDNLDLWAEALGRHADAVLRRRRSRARARHHRRRDARLAGPDRARRRHACTSTLIRNTPLTLVFFFFAFALPPCSACADAAVSLMLAICALGIYTATYVAETIRSGINTVPVGQAEAARAIGLTFGQVMSLVVLPQAFRSVIPPMMSVFIALLKNTTVAAGLLGRRTSARSATYLSERGENQLVVDPVGDGRLRRPRAAARRGCSGRSRTSGGSRDELRPVRRPRPRAIAATGSSGSSTVLVVARASLGFVVWRFIDTGQFTAEKWYAFTFTRVWVQIGLGDAAHPRGLRRRRRRSAHPRLRARHRPAVRPRLDAACRSRRVIEFFRAVPVLVFMLLLYYGLPVIGIKMAPYWAVVIALVAYNGSVLAEVIRAGVESLPQRSDEAATPSACARPASCASILLPQAIRAMMPVIIAQLVVTLKDTALGFIITYPELLFYAKYIGSQPPSARRIIPATIVVGAIYIALCLILSFVATLVEKRLRRSPQGAGRRSPVRAQPTQESTDTALIVTPQARRLPGGADRTDRRAGRVPPPVGRLVSRVRRSRDHPRGGGCRRRGRARSHRRGRRHRRAEGRPLRAHRRESRRSRG